ncbi:RNA polymerase sigma-70 factor [Parabacteroides goldsteinii]|uniref:RNA polymerase sigma-70 factor n=1 Tax=Parabacteroides goldsteinii TaxID=328812 RepID=UPI0024918F45|nr:RNA polymerase sigma-70 factor [Parabacteroides goldsteinii]
MDFEQLYITWYSRLKFFAREYVLSDADAENIVQDIFTDLYEKREVLEIPVNMVAYLFTATKNRCINHIHRKILEQETSQWMQDEYSLILRMKFNSLEAFDLEFASDNEIESRLEKALQSLPERCREIFIMNKFEGIKQKDIAKLLNISVNTVENQMAVAYKKLREELKDYIPLLILLLGI